MCQIIRKIPKIPVHVSNYTADNEDICPCVKLIQKLSKIVLGPCVKFEIIIYYQISIVLVLIVYHRENTHLLLVQKYSNFIYKLWTITAIHCKYTVSDKPTPPTMHRVPAMGTNECIAMSSTHKCREGYQELLSI